METTPQSTTPAMLSRRYDIPLSQIRAALKTIGVFVGRDAATLTLSGEHVAHVLASFPEETARPLAEIPIAVLLEQYGSILAELRARDVVRTANAPVGDYAEYLAQQAYGGTLAQSSAKSYDLITDDLQTIQVKLGRWAVQAPERRRSPPSVLSTSTSPASSSSTLARIA